MKNGPQRFDFFINQFEALLIKAGKQKNSALFLYKNNARTPLFMLEALAKLYAELHNSNCWKMPSALLIFMMPLQRIY
jgi:hypothetical protein